MKFVILLLAFFIPLLTTTGALKCYECQPVPGIPGFHEGLLAPLEWSMPQNETIRMDCSTSTGIEQTCANVTNMYCAKITPVNNKVSARSCMRFAPNPVFEPPGCRSGGPQGYDRSSDVSVCLCEGDFCNGHVKIVGMSVTTLLGGVLAVSLMNYL